jgi:N-acetylglucosamine-6-phosphate deacetylase
MAKLLISHATVVGLDRLLPDHSVFCENGVIKKIAPSSEMNSASADEVIDAGGEYLSPGFIDLHFHGVHEHLMDDGAEHFEAITRILPQYGVTGLLPCICPRPKGEDAAYAASVSEVKSAGCHVFGFHYEGPFLTLTGALPKDALGGYDPERVSSLIEAAKPYPSVFSIAPDFDQIIKLLPAMTAGNMPAFITHTRASVEETLAAVEAGACHATHFYDVFPIPDDYEPGARPCGAVEVILADPNVSVDFILDGEHVMPIAVKMALQCKSPDKVCLITDSNVGAGLPPGRYGFMGTEVEFKYPGGPARMTEKAHWPGALAGSGLVMDQAVRNAIDMVGVDLPLAVRMASANPAKVLRMDDTKGQIKTGYDADMCLLDKELEVQQTWVSGKSVFQREAVAR